MCRNDIIEDMSTVKLLDEKTRKRWTAIFVGVVVCIAITCISIMNIHYDELARYPYKDERSRELIKEYLNKEEGESKKASPSSFILKDFILNKINLDIAI